MWLAVAVWDPVLHLKLLLGGMDLGQELDEIKKKSFLTLFYMFRRSAPEGLAGMW